MEKRISVQKFMRFMLEEKWAEKLGTLTYEGQIRFPDLDKWKEKIDVLEDE